MNTMTIILPRAQATCALDLDYAQDEATAVPLVFESMAASSEAGGSSAWDSMPLGRAVWG